ncbi:CHAT domain-containing tetratricopeptide repeat protein [Tychonema sp. LEGE 06208]|uniref:CHAT domain-containing protein n=1 Tax=Tychonema sp. LEGE 06208 TaxID=1828663 RepID=UPI001D13BC73|nr:CHAT domain-containing tetratricopeptide repeat protein [Tychonema sp. LEGE 06208]
MLDRSSDRMVNSSAECTMDEQRRKTDVNMLQALLENPVDSGIDLILKTNSKSIDFGFVQTLYLEVPALTPDSLLKAAKFFQRAIAPLESANGNPQTGVAYLIFLAEALQAVAGSSDSHHLYSLLRNNLDKLDHNFAELLRCWALLVLPAANQSETRRMAALIGNLSNKIGRFPLGTKANNLEIEIAGYETVAKVFTRKDFPQEWAAMQNNLGNAYSDRPKGDKAQNIELAIACFVNALEVQTPEEYPSQWATLQNNLGSAYSDRLRGDPAENLEQAIACYQNALKVRTREAFGVDWASTQNNLGRAYTRRLQGSKAQNLELAVACYHNALQVYNRKVFPRRWATTQNNLANAYCEQLRGNRAENLEYAVTCYQRALQVRTKEAFPQQWATTQKNLGRVFIDRAKGDPVENLEMAISCFQNALQVYTRIKFPELWASIQTYLGRIYTMRVKGDKAENIEIAIACYQNALLFCNRPKTPERWAMLCTNLGRAFSQHLKGEKNRNLKSAIACYQNAARVYTKQAAPERWAMLQIDLGRAFAKLTEADNLSHLDRAIGCYLAACQVYTRETYPHHWLQIVFYLGQAYRVRGELLRACSVFAAAVDTVELLRPEAGVDAVDLGDRIGTAKVKLASISTGLYKGLVQVCLELGNTQPAYRAKALEYAERHKNRNLVELLLKCDLTPKGDFSAEVLGSLKSLQLEIARAQRHEEQSEAESSATLISEGDSSSLNSGSLLPSSDFINLNQLWRQFDGLIARSVQANDPFFSLAHKVEPIAFEQIRQLLPDANSAAVVWASFEDLLVAFVVVADVQYPAVHLCSPENALAVESWAREYLSAYSEQKGRWINHLPARLKRLAALLEIDRLVALIPQNCDRLIFVPHRFLHALPLHALPLGVTEGLEEGGGIFKSGWNSSSSFEGEAHSSSDVFARSSTFGDVSEAAGYLIDRFAGGIRYAPSCELLRLRQSARGAAIGRYRPRLQHLLAVPTFTKSSLYSNLEIGTISEHFSSAEILRQKPAIQQAFSQKTGQLQQKKCAHFACLSVLNLAESMKSAVLLRNDSLSLEEIFNLDFRQYFLVTLSACEIAGGFPSAGEDFVGLSAGLLYAGTSSAVSSLWRVNDISMLLLTSKFYENLGRFPRLQVGDVAMALIDAQRWLRDLTSEELEVLLADFQPQISQTFDRLSQSSRLIAEASLQQIRNRKPCPFANPYHWAAFTAAGV